MFKKLRPAPGLKILHPHTLRHLAEAGEVVELESYWVRLLACGDVTEVVDVEQIPDSTPSEG